MSAPIHPRADMTAFFVQAWHAWADAGSMGLAATALEIPRTTVNTRCGQYRLMMGLPSTARPWDLTGRAPDTDLDWLLASMEAAEAAGDEHAADAARSRIRYLERRRYGVGLQPLSVRVVRALKRQERQSR